jgi:hypothetical protein
MVYLLCELRIGEYAVLIERLQENRFFSDPIMHVLSRSRETVVDSNTIQLYRLQLLAMKLETPLLCSGRPSNLL